MAQALLLPAVAASCVAWCAARYTHPSPEHQQALRAAWLVVAVMAVAVPVVHLWQLAGTRPEAFGFAGTAWWPLEHVRNLHGFRPGPLMWSAQVLVVLLLLVVSRLSAASHPLDRDDPVLPELVLFGTGLALAPLAVAAPLALGSASAALGWLVVEQLAIVLGLLLVQGAMLRHRRPAADLLARFQERLDRYDEQARQEGGVSGATGLVEQALRDALCDPTLLMHPVPAEVPDDDRACVPAQRSAPEPGGPAPAGRWFCRLHTDEGRLVALLDTAAVVEDLATVLQPTLSRAASELALRLAVVEQRRLNAELQQAAVALGRLNQDLQEAQASLADLNSRLVHAQEGEQLRIQGEFHDHLQYEYTKLIRDLREQADLGAVDTELVFDLTGRVRKLREDADAVIRGQIIGVLRSGLPAALAEQAALGFRTWNVDCEDVEDLPTQQFAFGVVNELLNNALKYAGASRVTISVRTVQADQANQALIGCVGAGSAWLRIQVTDDGRGGATIMDKVTGLGPMRRRFLERSGAFALDSETGRGTSVVGVVPRQPGLDRSAA